MFSVGWEKFFKGVEYVFFGLTCGYGVRPLRPLMVGGLLIGVFTLIYFSRKSSLEYKIINEAFVKLPNKTPELDFSGHIKNRIRYGANKKLLIFEGIMSVQEKDELIKLTGEDKSYRRAIEVLFKRSQGKRREIRFFEMPWHRRLGNCFYFSVSSFATVGFGGISPRGFFKVAAMGESVLGWFTLALFLATLANVLLR
jgi:hypothetical protein